MEKKLRLSRKNRSLFNQNGQNVDPITSQFICDEEKSAKNMLFQLAENDFHLVDQKTFQPNQWLKTQTKIPKKQSSTPIRPLKYMRKTMHIRAFAQLKLLNQSYQSQNKLEKSIIPHLKLQLKKLESPEKRRQYQQKKKKLEYLQQKLKRKNDLIQVQELLQNKRHSIRVKKAQSQTKPSNLTFFNNFAQSRPKTFNLTQKSYQQNKISSEQIETMKQARKNRTLKNLLF